MIMIYYWDKKLEKNFVQSTGPVEYTDCFSAVG